MKQWYHVWRGNKIDDVFETATAAKKHAAWLAFTYKNSNSWWNRIYITFEGDEIPFDDYEFKNGDSRKIKKLK